MARALLIFNPVAARANLKIVDTVVKVFKREGWSTEVEGTSRVGHAKDLARAGVEGGVDLVAVYGGDGTTMQAVAGMIDHHVPVALIPGGTGNLLAGNLRLPRRPAAAARVAIRGRPRAIDLGILPREDGLHYFAVGAGAGFDAVLMTETTGEAKRRWRMGAYVATGVGAVSRLKAVRHRITIDGTPMDVEAAMVLVANCGEIVPPFLRLRKGIAPDDGVFDVIIVNATTVMQGAHALWRLATGLAADNFRIRFARGQEVVVEPEELLPVQYDGEAAGWTPFTARIVPHAISVMVPRT
ncbi:MAG: diacylglycerol kinase family protein [Gemmatimonadota bacterium]|nr:diacylglycerol kinase family protein [Gemmatimonadota bacterium]MDH3478519.1 diacylglycerol kinase family protein [Gemmatimonadota bacterium]MDH5548422.1 diacylglycerol kinase family protein [Gemmatimonadota bacterium]